MSANPPPRRPNTSSRGLPSKPNLPSRNPQKTPGSVSSENSQSLPVRKVSPRPSGTPQPSTRPRPNSTPQPNYTRRVQPKPSTVPNPHSTQQTPSSPVVKEEHVQLESPSPSDRFATPQKESVAPENFAFAHDPSLDENNTENLNDEVEKVEVYHNEDPDAYRYADYDEEKESAPKAKKKRGKKRKSIEPSKEQEVFFKSGNRRNVWLVRGAVSLVAVSLMGFGIKNAVFPPAIPSPSQVVSVVNESNGIKGFPTEKAMPFVQEFLSDYLTVNPRDDREAKMKKYVGDERASLFTASSEDTETKQTVTKGPYISADIKQDDASHATFTASAQLNGSRWVYLNVPVFADVKSGALSISGTPTFIAPPSLANFEPTTESRSKDDALSSSLTTDVTAFFKAWGASDTTALSRIVAPDASNDAKTGLGNGVQLAQLFSLNIYQADDGNDNIRNGTVQVLWTSTPVKGTKGITYSQNYNITVEKLDDNRWYIKDVQGNVLSNDSAD